MQASKYGLRAKEHCSMRPSRLLLLTALTTGPRFATSVLMARNQHNMSPPVSSAIRTSTTTADGRPFPNMAPSGSRIAFRLDGLLIATATGYGSHLGDGPGSMMRLGASHPSTMAAGSLTADIGAGLPVLCT